MNKADKQAVDALLALAVDHGPWFIQPCGEIRDYRGVCPIMAVYNSDNGCQLENYAARSKDILDIYGISLSTGLEFIKAVDFCLQGFDTKLRQLIVKKLNPE